MFKIKISKIFIALVLIGATSCSDPNNSSLTDTANVVTTPPKGNSDTEYFNQGQYKSKTGYYQEAINDYTQAIRINPNYADAYLKRGIARDVLQDFHGAIEDFTEVIRINPNNAEAYNKRGISRLSLKIPDLQGAIEDHTQFVRIDPNNADIMSG
jgi:tetratricopeptide (TPR) repeat protein